MAKIRYVIEIDETGAGTLDIGKGLIKVSQFTSELTRVPEPIEPTPDGFAQYRPGQGGMFILTGRLEYEPPAAQSFLTPKDVIAQAIFDWLTTDPNAPFTYNSDLTPLETGVDGELDCRELATFIADRLQTVA